MGVLYKIIFSHTPDEAMSGGLAKACFPRKKLFCSRENRVLIEYQTEWRNLHAFIPKYILLDNDFELLAFPYLFQYCGGGYHSANRQVKLPIRKYFQQHLLNVDGRFAQNIEYLFCAQYIAGIKQIESDATLAIMLSQGRTLGGHKITAGHL